MGKFKRKKNTQRIETGPSLTELAEIEKFGERRFKYFNRCAWCQMPKEKLLYNEKTLNQVSELAQILDRKNFKAIENRALLKRPNLAFIVLLHGPSGTGKTALVRDLCRRTKRNMLDIRSDLLRNSNVGDDEKVLVEMFEDLKIFDLLRKSIRPIVGGLLLSTGLSLFYEIKKNMQVCNWDLRETVIGVGIMLLTLVFFKKKKRIPDSILVFACGIISLFFCNVFGG